MKSLIAVLALSLSGCATAATEEEPARAGCDAEAARPVGIIVRRGRHYRGAWCWKSGRYAFTPAGYSEATLSAATIDEAVRVTRQIALK